MARIVAYHGERFTIAFARDKSDACCGFDFFDGLNPLDKAKLMALFRILGDHGKFYNNQKFGDLGGGLYEFKSFQIRMPFAYAKERRLILITHGFIKKKDKTPKEEIARAWRIFNEDQGLTKLAIVRKAKQ